LNVPAERCDPFGDRAQMLERTAALRDGDEPHAARPAVMQLAQLSVRDVGLQQALTA
jgi:hypothetical protein